MVIQVKEEYSDDDDIPWAERMAKEKGEKPTDKKKDSKKRKGGSDSEDEYKPEVRSSSIVLLYVCPSKAYAGRTKGGKGRFLEVSRHGRDD